ncbi:capsular synthesis regulator component B [Cordyceps fumosorosea ARSEF 2679]|uniref:Capsular synthesis regulator component B n=1 Tax=Cordyceps fumosorosea (strain ARSEF 2679) TaxID=1081104 RepID=A0A167LHL3_CORFA|nr:capsular synthesis regulator component B [Cordyceps fumosorosea ARSEF 2679]OAA53103.1 capsular synthesis regulator component B [Cordyceps fumosorosea ARSEF 2679]
MVSDSAFTGRPIRVVLADGQPDVIASFKKTFSSTTYPDIVATACTPEDLQRALSSTPRLDAVLLDSATFGEASVLQAVQDAHPALPVIYLSHNPASDTLENIVLRRATAGVVRKDDKPEDLAYAVEAVLEGDPEGEGAAGGVNPNRLTVREREVLKYLLDAMTTGEIAAEVHRSLKTISALKQSGCDKLGVQSIAGLFKLKDRII